MVNNCLSLPFSLFFCPPPAASPLRTTTHTRATSARALSSSFSLSRSRSRARSLRRSRSASYEFCCVCRGGVPKALREYASGLGGYKKNDFNRLEPKVKQRVAEEWAPSFTEFGYEF